MAEVDELFWTLKADTKQLTQGVMAAQGRLQKFTNFMRGPTGPIAAVTILGTVALLTAVKLGKMAAELDEALREVGTLLPGTVADLKDVRQEIIAMSTRVPLPPVQLTKALYQAVSAGARDTREALMLVEVASKAAVAGLTDAFTAVDAITTVLNAYQMSAFDAERVSDVLFKTVEQGKIKFEEIASVIGNVATTAALMGVSIEEVGASMAVMTKFGFGAAEATTALNRFMLQAVSQTDDMVESAKEMGFEFTTFSSKTRTFTQMLIEMEEATGGQVEQLAKLNPNIRAAKTAFIEAAGGQEEYLRILKEAQRSMGTTQTAYEEMAGSFQNQSTLLKQKVNAELLYLGQYVLEGVLLPAVGKLNELLPETEGGLAGVLSRLEQFGQYRGDLRSVMETLLWFSMGGAGGRLLRGELGTTEGALGPGGQMLRRRQEDQLQNISGLGDLESVLYPTGNMGGAATGPVAKERLEAAKQLVLDGLAEIDAKRKEYGDSTVERIEREGKQAVEWIDNELNRYIDAEKQKERLSEEERKKREQEEIERAREVARERAALEEDLAGQIEKLTMNAAEIQLKRLGEQRDAYIELLGGAEAYYNAVSEGVILQGGSAAEFEKQYQMLKTVAEKEAARLEVAEKLRQSAEAQAEAFAEIDARHAMVIDNEERSALIAADRARFIKDELKLVTQILQAHDAEGGLLVKDEGLRRKISARVQELLKLLKDVLGVQEDVTDETEAEAEARKKAEAAAANDKRLRDMLQLVQLVEQGARGALDFAKNVGLINEELADTVSAMLQVAEGAATLAAGIASGNPGAIISGGLGLMGGISNLVGESPEDKARREALERNTVALHQLRKSYDDQRSIALGASGGTTSQLQSLFAGLDFTPGGFSGIRDWMKDIGTFNERMRELGVTAEDVQQMVSNLGLPVNLIIQDGVVAAGSLQQVQEALEEIGVGDWAAGFAGQMDSLRREFELFDIDDPLEQLKRIKAEFEAFTGLEVPDFDLDSAEGRAAFEEWIQEMFTRSQILPMSGGLTFGDLGGMSTQELLDTFGSMENLLDQIADAAEDGADSTGQSTSFQTVSRITIEQADKLIAQGSTQIFYLRQMAEALTGAGGSSGVLGPKRDPGFWATGIQPPSRGEVARFSDTLGDFKVMISEGAIVVNESVYGEGTAHEILNQLNTQLQEQTLHRKRGTGAAPQRTW